MIIYYEAWDDTETEQPIYSGSSRSELIIELLDYIYYQNHIDEDAITEEEIRSLDTQKLMSIGVRLYVNSI